jgi:large subunit ribosomal protein L20
MPRSVNSVAAKARRKGILKAAKGYFGRRKNVHTVAKNAVEKGCNTHTVTEKIRRELSVHYGFKELMQEQDNTECLTHNLWVKSMLMELS